MALFKKKTHWERMMKQITEIDYILIKLTSFTLGLAVATSFPQLVTGVDPYWYLIATAIFALKPILVWLRTA